MRNCEDLFRRFQVLRDQLSELILLRRLVSNVEKRARELKDKRVPVRMVTRNFETAGRQSLVAR